MLTEIKPSYKNDSADLFKSGIRPAITAYLKDKQEAIRDYGDYWSASSAGYCMRLNILKRLKIPPINEIREDDERNTRVFEAGHIFHEWMQRITTDAGLSIGQELELQDEKLMVRGHIDDLIEINGGLILYDYKTANSQAFNYAKPTIGHYHKMQLATYMYMLRNEGLSISDSSNSPLDLKNLTEGRIMQISKDDLRMREQQLLFTTDLEKQVVQYWKTLQGYWVNKQLPVCTCLNFDGGFMGKRSAKGKIYNQYFYNEEPCSIEWASKFKELLAWSIT